MEDINLPDVNKVRGSGDSRELPPQTSAEDTSNWETRAIALPDPQRSSAQFMLGDNSNVGISIALAIGNPYLEQERLKSVKRKK